MVRTAFSGYDTGDLIGLHGASYIIRLSDSAPESNRVYCGVQRFVNGKPDGPLTYPARYIAGYKEKTRCWLIDIAVLPEMFPQHGRIPHALCFARFKALDGTGRWLTYKSPLVLPDSVKSKAKDTLTFGFRTSSWISERVNVGEDIRLGCWYEVSPETNRAVGIDESAKRSPLAYVFYARFQHEHPSGPSENDEKASGSAREARDK
jgi:hypothetical protein